LNDPAILCYSLINVDIAVRKIANHNNYTDISYCTINVASWWA